MSSSLLKTTLGLALTGALFAAHAAQPAPWEEGYEFTPNPNPRNFHVWSCLTSKRKDLCNAAHYRVTEGELQSTMAEACEPKRVFPNDMVRVAQIRVAYPDDRPTEEIDCH